MNTGALAPEGKTLSIMQAAGEMSLEFWPLVTDHWPLVLESKMNRSYEVMFIVRPDMVDEDVNKLISTLESTVTTAGGTAKSEVWGKRRLAYKVAKFNDGIFVLLMIEGPGAIIHEVERRLRVTEQVIKFITVRTDEELKRLDKVKKLRDARQKRSAVAPVTPEAAATEPAAAPAPTA